MPNVDPRSKVTIEDLLRLKRSERPPLEFWNRFESELRQKQLAALLQRRPWWQALPSFVTRRAYLPIGAAAIAAFTLVSVRYYSSTRPVATFEPLVSHAAHLQPSAAARPVAVALAAPPVEHKAAAEPVVAELSERLPDRASELTPWSVPRKQETASAKSIAAGIASLVIGEPDLSTSALGNEYAPTRANREDAPPMVEMALVSTMASRRSRLLAQLDDRRFAPEPQAPEMVRERLARRLADTDFNDNFSRVGIDRGGVSLKF